MSTILIRDWCQLLDVARGLAYMHHYDIVHGNLTGVSANLQVRNSGVDGFAEKYPSG